MKADLPGVSCDRAAAYRGRRPGQTRPHAVRANGKERVAASMIAWALAWALIGGNAGGQADPGAGNAAPAIPAGTYRLDPRHASLVFRVNHVGFSYYTGQFADFDATLDIDPARPERARLSATVDLASLIIPSPTEAFLSDLLAEDWLDAGRFAQMRYQSTSIERIDDQTAMVTGNLTFRGRTLPLTFAATFNGGYAGLPVYDPQARIGFVAEGRLKRSDFGMTIGLPPEGSSMGVGDEVDFRIDAEFTGPPMAETANTEP